MAQRASRIAFLLFIVLIIGQSLQAASKGVEIFAYRGYDNPQSEKLLLIGEIISRSHLMGKRQKMLGFDTREMILTAKLFDSQGLRLNDTIYVIKKDPNHKRYKNGYIVAEAEIISIFETGFQGPMLKAQGNLSMVSKGQYIAIRDQRQSQTEAFAYFKQAERFDRLDDQAHAYSNYRKSLQADTNRPETYVELAKASLKTNRTKEAVSYIEEAFKRRRNFTEANEYLKLGGLYLQLQLSQIDAKDNAQNLRNLLHLKRAITLYQDGLEDFKTSFPKNVLDMLKRKGLPNYEFNYYNGVLNEQIYAILKNTSLHTVLSWLEKNDRELLYAPIRMPYREISKADPRQIWEQAYFHAAVYHYELAHEIDNLDTRAAYRLVIVASTILRDSPTKTKQEVFTAMLQHYGNEFLKVPNDDQQMSRVRSLLNTFAQP